MRTKQLSKLIGYGTFLILAVSVGWGTIQTHKLASASTFGAPLNTGYYDGTAYNPNDRRFFFQDGIPLDWATNTYGTTAQEFIDQVSNYLNNTGPNALSHQQEYDDARASVMINTMMGVQSQDPRYDLNPALPRWQNGVILAKQLFNSWAAMVQAYATPGNIYGGSVDFNYHVYSAATDINGSGIGDANLPITGDYQGSPQGTAHGDYPDVVFAPLSRPEDGPAIRFTHADGTTYTIKKWCGNLIGDESPFPLKWQHVPSLTPSTPPGTISGTTPTTLNFTGNAKNIGATASNGGILAINVEQTGQAAKVLVKGAFPSLGSGQTTQNLQTSFTVPAFTPAGTQFCFYTSVNPSTPTTGETDSSRKCYSVAYTSNPAVQGLNGDIQAGGGLCTEPNLSNGSAIGNAQNNSVGDYVVAASGLVSNFKSNATGINNLTLGSSGGYNKVCRPDLLAAANAGRTPGAAVITGNAVDLGNLTGPGKPDVYYFDGANLSLSGTVHSKVTIVLTNGNAHITAPIILDSTPAAPSFVPSIGIISKGYITIDPIVTRVDAYLFSNSYIDTCTGATPGSTSCTTPQLVVNGFLMAHDIHFNRVGAFNSGGAQISEKIILTPQLYLNPPRFFEASKTDILQPQGEKQPLF